MQQFNTPFLIFFKNCILCYAVNLQTIVSYKAMKKICLFVNLFLVLSLALQAQVQKSVPASISIQDSLNKNIKLTDSLKVAFPLQILPAKYYTNNLGFFCKQELKIQQTIKLPFVFRLGSVEYNNYLEQKPNAVKP